MIKLTDLEAYPPGEDLSEHVWHAFVSLIDTHLFPIFQQNLFGGQFDLEASYTQYLMEKY